MKKKKKKKKKKKSKRGTCEWLKSNERERREKKTERRCMECGCVITWPAAQETEKQTSAVYAMGHSHGDRAGTWDYIMCYQISYCLDSREPLRWTTVEVGSTARQFTVTGLSSEQTYVFRLTARTSVGWGEEQEALVVTTERRACSSTREQSGPVRTVIASCAGREMSASVPLRISVADTEHRPV
ncbi:unnamed protein product [Pleuronectes platessa]|uniref:Fibronectin type-III domain-containing protein n=1 Tax=Pleuronectes platessa TaxID=8262 RepID=A0A9N7Y9C6_PLEPL|nr:unnamed protein product [Pleuronectes platessa]